MNLTAKIVSSSSIFYDHCTPKSQALSILKTPDYIHFTDTPAETLQKVLTDLAPDKVAYLVDENTQKHCLPLLGLPEDSLVIAIKSGEKHKTLDTCQHIWEQLTTAGFSRKSLLVNLGGGVIGDMGGFTAATYKRGIRFVNIPTTLLAAVDANIGGKLGIDFMGFKNHIGVFQDPDAVIVSDIFLKTLPARELRSGFAEVIKHGLIYDQKYYEQTSASDFPDLDWNDVIRQSIAIKGAVVAEDPREGGLRKILNFGHTLGHGIETWYLNASKSLLHGEAIAIGMILEAYLSYKTGKLSLQEVNAISDYLTGIYGTNELPPLDEVMKLMGQDKKNVGSEIRFSLLERIGACLYDVTVSAEWIRESYKFYENLK